MKTIQPHIYQKQTQIGGTRTTEEQGISKEIIFTGESGKDVPATQTIINPKVEGVIVTLDGTIDGTLKNDIISAVVAVTGVQTHKVQVFCRGDY